MHFCPVSDRNPSTTITLDTISFEYWHSRAKEEDFQRDPMRKAAERVYSVLKDDTKQITKSCLDIVISVPWA